MGGGSYWHNLVKDNLARGLGNRLASRGCTVLTSDQRVKVDATGLYTRHGSAKSLTSAHEANLV